MVSRILRFAVALFVAAGASGAQQAYTPSPENLAARQWYQDAEFGMFVHCGVSSVLQDGEWVMNNRHVTVSDYESLPPYFNPAKFDARAWVAAAKGAGMKYITLITKHHDGIALRDSKVSDWTIPKRTPFGRDIVKALADECRRQDVKLFFYYSQLDWHHADYRPRGQTGAPLPGEDVQTFERDLPGASTAGFNTTTVGSLPLETSETTNESSGFRLNDNKWKSSPTLIRELADAAGRNANFLLNVGPRPDGTIPDSALARLGALGDWMRVNDASIYGTRGGPVRPRRWGVTMQREDQVVVLVLAG